MRVNKNKNPTLAQGGNRNDTRGWDSLENDDSYISDIFNRYETKSINRAPVKSKSTEDIYTQLQLEAFAAGNKSFFAENESKPGGLPPNNQRDDFFFVVSQILK